MTNDQPRPDAADSRQSLALSYYGELVRRQWESCLPNVYQQIRDPGAFFAVIGEVIAQRIDEHADYLAGDDQPGEGYLAKVARLTAARDRAKERVLADWPARWFRDMRRPCLRCGGRGLLRREHARPLVKHADSEFEQSPWSPGWAAHPSPGAIRAGRPELCNRLIPAAGRGHAPRKRKEPGT